MRESFRVLPQRSNNFDGFFESDKTGGASDVEMVMVVSADLFERSFVTGNSQVLLDNGQEVSNCLMAGMLAGFKHSGHILLNTPTIKK